jgi:hypothetical protein
VPVQPGLEEPAETKSDPCCSFGRKKSITLDPPGETLWKKKSEPMSPPESISVSTHITIECTNGVTIAAKGRKQEPVTAIAIDC